ncbi:hypothetical protein Pla52n_31520 [Stieleria varia]|uniref:Bacterial extracellular solute-binding protein n=2 Tax=Stieleria varia TaxID=2528005 RepID=A0A5C6B1J4_9BACT|nr:hypothetical protein Pla52n_31520 [Stieleria varia]
MLGVAAATATVGCGHRPTESPTETTRETRTDVPLRLLLVGSDSEAEAVRRGWGALSPVPLDVTVVAADRSRLSGIGQIVSDKLASIDVAIYPLIVMSQLAASEHIVAETDESFDDYETELGKTYPALISGACRFADQYFAVSLGSKVPALLSVEEVDELPTWSDYHDWVQTLDGKAAEPLAEGWAASSFLQRAASTVLDTWLFDRNDVSPLINTEPYINVLSQMLDTARLYQGQRKTSAEIWTALRSGELKGGIGFQPAKARSDWAGQASDPDSADPNSAATDVAKIELDITASDLPSELQSPRVLLDSLSPVASISNACRQTRVSRQFLSWISGGENRDAMLGQMSSMTPSRTSTQATAVNVSGYNRWLADRLRTSLVRPGLQLIDGGKYFDALESQVVRCLDGQAKPAEALSEVANQWQAITAAAGPDRQRAIWRRL